MCVHVSLSRIKLYVTPMYSSPPGSSVHVILLARILEWVAIPFSRGSSWPRDETQASCIEGRFFNVWATREAPSLEVYLAPKVIMLAFNITDKGESVHHLMLLLGTEALKPGSLCSRLIASCMILVQVWFFFLSFLIHKIAWYLICRVAVRITWVNIYRVRTAEFST